MIKARVESDSFHGFEEDVLSQLRPIAEELVNEGADMLHAEIDRRLSRRGPPIPGAPPAEVTTELRGALRRGRVMRKGKNKFQADVEIPADSPAGGKAGRLEFGGEDDKGRYSGPHSYMRTSEAAVGPKFRALVAERLNP